MAGEGVHFGGEPGLHGARPGSASCLRGLLRSTSLVAQRGRSVSDGVSAPLRPCIRGRARHPGLSRPATRRCFVPNVLLHQGLNRRPAHATLSCDGCRLSCGRRFREGTAQPTGVNSRCNSLRRLNRKVRSHLSRRAPGGPCWASESRMSAIRSRIRSKLTRTSARAIGAPGQV